LVRVPQNRGRAGFSIHLQHNQLQSIGFTNTHHHHLRTNLQDNRPTNTFTAVKSNQPTNHHQHGSATITVTLSITIPSNRVQMGTHRGWRTYPLEFDRARETGLAAVAGRLLQATGTRTSGLLSIRKSHRCARPRRLRRSEAHTRSEAPAGGVRFNL